MFIRASGVLPRGLGNHRGSRLDNLPPALSVPCTSSLDGLPPQGNFQGRGSADSGAPLTTSVVVDVTWE